MYLLGGMSLLGSGLVPYNSLVSACDDVNVHLVPAYEGSTNGQHSGIII